MRLRAHPTAVYPCGRLPQLDAASSDDGSDTTGFPRRAAGSHMGRRSRRAAFCLSRVAPHSPNHVWQVRALPAQISDAHTCCVQKKKCIFSNIFMSFCKIIGFIEQIYENKSLSPNHVFTFKISRFATFIFLLIIFIKSSVLLNKFISLQILIAKPHFLLLKFQGLRFLYVY